MADSSVCPLPSCAFWNMQFLSVHNSLHWSEKIANVKALVSKHSVVALSETHISDGVSAETFFFQHIPRSTKFIGHGMACVLDDDFCSARGICGDNIYNIILGVAMTLKWEEGLHTCWVLHFRLDAHGETTRCSQLGALGAWIAEHVCPGDILIF